MGKRLLAGLIAVAVMPLSAQAAISEANLAKLELGIWKVRANFHMYTVMEGNQKYDKRLNAAIQEARRAMQSLSRNAEGNDELTLVKELQSQFGRFQEAAKSNTYASQGYTSSYVIQDVNDIPAIMQENINAFSGGSSGEYDDILKMAAHLQHMSSEYLKLAAAPTGGMATGSGEGRIEFEDAVPVFEDMLAQAKKKHSGDEAMARALKRVDTKWHFIRGSMMKFYENAVPFLIYRYTAQMTDTLDQAMSLSSTEVEKPSFGPAQ